MLHVLFNAVRIAPFLIAATVFVGGTAFVSNAIAQEARLIGHWPLQQDSRDVSGNGLHGVGHQVEFVASGDSGRLARYASFNGINAWIDIPLNQQLMGNRPFSFTTWVYVDESTTDLPGAIASRFDFEKNTGFSLGLITHSGVTSNQPNFRQLEFSMNANRQDAGWTDHGRPGEAMLIFALCSHEGELYAGTCESGENQAGHVYRWANGTEWIDCGAPDKCNSVSALATFQGELYAGVSKYRLAGSSLAESQNPNLGGKIYRYAGGKKWIDCGQIPSAEAIGGLVVFGDRLYASSLYKPAGFYRYSGEKKWEACPLPEVVPGEPKRVEAMSVWNNSLYASSYDLGHVFRFDGKNWTDLGQVGEAINTQIYSFAVYRGELYVGSWASGKVFRYGGGQRWIDCGRLGEELEVMGMLVYNAQLYAGTLPLAEVYRFDGKSSWMKHAQLDSTPGVKYRRAWTMAQHQGRLFCGTLPTGKVWSFGSGVVASNDRTVSTGWHHVAAVRDEQQIRLYLDGKEVAAKPAKLSDYDLTVDQPLRLGAGTGDYLKGRLFDVRLYDGAISKDAVSKLAAPSSQK